MPATGFVHHPDTDLVGEDGGFNEAKLDEVFREHGRTFDGMALTLRGLLGMVTARVTSDAARSPRALALARRCHGGRHRVGRFVLGGSHLPSGKARARARHSTPLLHRPAVFHDIAQRVGSEREERSRAPLGQWRNRLQDWVL